MNNSKDKMMTGHIIAECSERILTIRFNRPDKKNALTKAMYASLADAVDRLMMKCVSFCSQANLIALPAEMIWRTYLMAWAVRLGVSFKPS
jgi:hypothetical protein